MIVLVAGTSRTGSMWTFNVTKAILEANGISVLPKQQPTEESHLLKQALASEDNGKDVYCIKTHYLLESPLATKHAVKIICNIRDVRDACLSFMRFTHADFNQGTVVMNHMMKETDHWLNSFKDNLISIRYEDLTQSPHSVCRNISQFLEVELSEKDLQDIVKRFDKATVQAKLNSMSDVKLDSEGRIIDSKLQSEFETVQNLDGTFRIYDKTTAFQSNHITSNADGEWRTYFDKNQIAMLNGLSRKWLLKYGYKI
jgi:Sulfotransferase domain